MSQRRAYLLCAFPALSAVLLASDGKTPAPADAGVSDAPRERGAPALFSWSDVDGDARLDLAAVSADGTLQLLLCAGDGRFEDVTERFGLAEVGNAAFALWADYDADGRLDLFVGARAGASRLFRNEGGAFVDMTEGSGLAGEGAVQSAQWFDHDGDGRLDLHVVTTERNELFRGLEGGFFERVELPPAGTPSVPGLAGPVAGMPSAPELGGPVVHTGGEVMGDIAPPSAPGSPREERSPDLRGAPGGSASAAAPAPSGGSSAPLLPPPPALGCMTSIKDQAIPSACLKASTTPVLGRLYPLSTNLFVALGGDVGIGTTSPTAKLHVAGTARMTDTLTLAPSGDQALDISTGSIYKGGGLFIHTKGGSDNTALGKNALFSVTSGYSNTATGSYALLYNTSGTHNTANGDWALFDNINGDANTASGTYSMASNVSGNNNTATGSFALFANSTGNGNTASGYRALRYNTSSFNTATGYKALENNTTGVNNTASGKDALRYSTTGSFNTASGTNALRLNTTANNNTAIGNSALTSNTTGANNTAIGNAALRDNTTVSSLTAIGNSALRYNSTGGGNSAMGDSALRYNTTGFNNTACGFLALRDNTTGYQNTAIGRAALQYNTTATRNTATGNGALQFTTTGSFNTAAGNGALNQNTTGNSNTATGSGALQFNTTGFSNAAHGTGALFVNTTGNYNTAVGDTALRYNTTGSDNAAVGDNALRNNTTGDGNIALGRSAGFNLTTGNNNIAIGNTGVAAESATIRIGTAGTQTRAFIAGIRGVTTGNANGIAVLIDSAGQLGTVSSSRRFKEEIRDMGDATERLLELRPVVFRYKPEVQSGERPLEYGLIAEEVAEHFPDLVVYDEEGQPFTVKYHLLSSMLLNEVKKLHGSMETQREEHARELEELRGRLAVIEGGTSPAASAAATLASSR